MKIALTMLVLGVGVSSATAAFGDSVPSANGGLVSGYTDSYTGIHYNNYYDDQGGHLQRGEGPIIGHEPQSGDTSKPVLHHRHKHQDKDSSQ